MLTSACAVALFGIASGACASGVVAGSAQALDAKVARAAILEAERSVRRAHGKRMLWTTAEEALRSARRAFEDGDLAAALAQAKLAKDHAELAMAQRRYPPYRF
jgi:protein-disulfide isomerase-like protein with CxxC motif